jgi:hypothetical protein
MRYGRAPTMNGTLIPLAIASFAVATATLSPAQAQLQVQPLAPAGTILTSACPLDVDGDGDLDLFGVAGNGLVGSYRLLANDGSGAFADVTAGNVPATAMPVSYCLVFDCDGDQDPDVFAGGVGGSELLRNVGGGTFVVAASWPQEPTTSATAGDLDGDGDLDLVLTTHVLLGGTNRIRVNQGAAGFVDLPPISFGGFGGSVTLVDHDDDGDLDVFFTGNPMLLRNDGGLVFTDVTATTLPASLMQTPVTASDIGDVDGDGDADFVLGGIVLDRVLLDVGTGYVLAGTLPASPSRAFSTELVDIDGDGDLDVVRSFVLDPMSVALNDGTGTFVGGAGRLPLAPIWSTWVRAVDLDGDDDDDLVSTFGGQALQLRNLQREVEPLAAVRGQPWDVGVWSEPGYATANALGLLGIAVTRLPAPVLVAGLGPLWLDPTNAWLEVGVVSFAAGARWWSFPIPPSPVLAGMSLHSQALIASASGAVRLTACRSVVIQ